MLLQGVQSGSLLQAFDGEHVRILALHREYRARLDRHASRSTVHAPQCEVRSRCAGRYAPAFRAGVDQQFARLDAEPTCLAVEFELTWCSAISPPVFCRLITWRDLRRAQRRGSFRGHRRLYSALPALVFPGLQCSSRGGRPSRRRVIERLCRAGRLRRARLQRVARGGERDLHVATLPPCILSSTAAAAEAKSPVLLSASS